MKSNAIAAASIAAFLFSAATLAQADAMALKDGMKEGVKEYTITIRNGLAKEKFAPVLIVGDADDGKIWVGQYVSKEARTQFTTGNPGPLAAVLKGEQGQPGKVAAAQEITFKFRTAASKARITAMVHPDVTPDNYVTALVDLKAGGATELVRYDIGDDEKRYTVEKIGPAGSVTVR
jgi:hypothetical protein